ncbi:MAG: type IV pilus modification protein PilV [Thiohalocapsa sp.]|nr:type IV pilus modification protein PilV [Thiohalocapsa sp.]
MHAKDLPLGRVQQRGFTLIEVLVTLVVVAIGAFGLAALQLTGMRSNYSAFQRTQATLAVNDLVDRVQGAPELFRGRRLDTASATGHAVFDAWRDELLRLGLGEPSRDRRLGELDCTAGNRCGSGHCAVAVRWDDSRAEAPPPVVTPPAEASRDVSELAFHVCTRLPLPAR